MSKRFFAALPLVALLGACAAPQGAHVVTGNFSAAKQNVYLGYVESVRPIYVHRDSNDFLTAAAATLGGITGSHVGKGTGSLAGAVIGAVAAGVASDKVQAAQVVQAYSVIVLLDNGNRVAIDLSSPNVSPGQRVQFLDGPTPRILPYQAR